MNKKIKLMLCLFLFAASSMPAYAGLFGKKEKGPPQIPARPVETAISSTKDVPVYIDSFGSMECLTNVDIKAQVTGQIESVHFTGGQDVSKGDLLFTIDPRPYKAELEKAQAALAADGADLELKQLTLERNKKLLERQLISQQDYDTYKTDVDSGLAKVNLDKASVDLAKLNLDYCYIVSPLDGRTGKCLVDPGNIIIANTGTALVNIKAIDNLYVDFTIPETRFDDVRNAMATGRLQTMVSPEESSDYGYSGELHFLDNAVDNTTGTILLRAIVQNKNRSLWSGQFVNVRLILGIEKDMVVVPYETVQLGQDGSYLFVVTPDNKAELRIVSTGSRWEDNIVVKKGLKAGEKVVTVGQMGLAPGVPVVDTREKK
ncbi:MAG: efflux RND transporter periplasmic adaptor subunit [Candidatus Omnitrophica bacterium]|nr:efflux RND transporter periplasmic adaptor subunit [Candidatus Omnitrophota bacterium]